MATTKDEVMATSVTQVYHCDLCGNIVEVVHAGSAALVCCGRPMDLYEENTVDAAKEKHVPVIEQVEGGFKVKVGEVAHPMEEKHYIEWIEVIADGRLCRQHLSPGDSPEALFECSCKSEFSVRALCNLHGLWKSTK